MIHITRPEFIGSQIWHKCLHCTFGVMMSFDPEYAVVVVDPGDPGTTHIAHGQEFTSDGVAPARSIPTQTIQRDESDANYEPGRG